MKSVMTHDFSRIPRTAAPRSKFDRSHGLKTAFDGGYLVPIELQEVLPGDDVTFNANLFARLAPCVTPVMDNVFLDTMWFFVPSRLVWTNFTKMMGERVNPSDSIDYLVPQLNSGGSGFAVGSLADYFGIPTGVADIDVNALPFRAYAKIWDDWFRDENLQNSIIQSSDDLGDSNGSIAWNTLLRRGKRHDYFTSCLTSPQKGDGVELPLGTEAPVRYGPGYSHGSGMSTDGLFFEGTGGVSTSVQGKIVALGATTDSDTTTGLPIGVAGHLNGGTSGTFKLATTCESAIAGWASGNSLYADLSTATSATINSLRMAFQLQRLLETDARSGTRFVELIRSHFNTICPDARLQRSEYLGGSSQLISFDEVPQTGSTVDGSTPQGNLVANGRIFTRCHWSKAFTEHGYIIGLANVRCDLNYQQGLNRLWSRRGRYDFFWPVLQNLGEQAVLNKEIYCQGTSDDDKAFGYQERYAEYRYAPSIVTGKMRSGVDGSLDVWHLAESFSTLPKLNASFIQDDPPLDRVLSVTDEPQIIMDAYLQQTWTRPMFLYSVPGLVDHL